MVGKCFAILENGVDFFPAPRRHVCARARVDTHVHGATPNLVVESSVHVPEEMVRTVMHMVPFPDWVVRHDDLDL